MAMPLLRPRFGDATAQADLPSATGPPAEDIASQDMRGLMLRRCGHAHLEMRRTAPSKVFMAFAWIGKFPLRTPGKKD